MAAHEDRLFITSWQDSPPNNNVKYMFFITITPTSVSVRINASSSFDLKSKQITFEVSQACRDIKTPGVRRISKIQDQLTLAQGCVPLQVHLT